MLYAFELPNMIYHIKHQTVYTKLYTYIIFIYYISCTFI